MTKFLGGLFAFIVLLMIIFILQNLSIIPVKFLFWAFEIRRVWLVFSLYLGGFLSGLIIAWLLLLRDRVKNAGT